MKAIFCGQGAEPVVMARRLLGQHLCRRTRQGICVGRIVETEAYLSEGDSACHAAVGPNRKNASMYGPPDRAYVYTIHARQCFNVVTQAAKVGSAVLIRALEPVHGIELMQLRRKTLKVRDLCRGPARLCEALDIGRDMDAWDLSLGRRLWIEADHEVPTADVVVSCRIGVTSAELLPLRFFVNGNTFVSGTRRQNTPLSSDSSEGFGGVRISQHK